MDKDFRKNAVDEKFLGIQESMETIFEKTNMKLIPSDDKEAAKIIESAELIYRIYQFNPSLTENVVEEMYDELYGFVNKFATEKGVTLETKSRNKTQTATY